MRAHTEANGSAAPVQATTAEDMPEACVKRAHKAIRAVLDGIPPRGDDENVKVLAGGQSPGQPCLSSSSGGQETGGPSWLACPGNGDSSSVMAGGMPTANLPHRSRNRRRSLSNTALGESAVSSDCADCRSSVIQWLPTIGLGPRKSAPAQRLRIM